LDRRLGNSITVRHTLVPTLWDTRSHSADNPFLNLFSNVDLVLIFQVILSLLVLLFAHYAIAGKREAGTLRLTMTNAVSRPIILLAKYTSAMVCLILPVVMSLLLALILFFLSGSILLSGDDWLRIGGILLKIPHVKAYFQFSEPRRIRAAERTWQIREEALNQVYVRKANVAKNLMRFSPAAMYDFATEAWAGTDYQGIEDFITTVQRYRQTIIDYFYNENAFSSRKWFAVDRGDVDWSDLPQFSSAAPGK